MSSKIFGAPKDFLDSYSQTYYNLNNIYLSDTLTNPNIISNMAYFEDYYNNLHGSKINLSIDQFGIEFNALTTEANYSSNFGPQMCINISRLNYIEFDISCYKMPKFCNSSWVVGIIISNLCNVLIKVLVVLNI